MAGIYIHIPFCRQACTYCDFHFSTSQKFADPVLSAIKKEILLRKDYLHGEIIETIYFGGGTPSLIELSHIQSILELIFREFNLQSDAEITLEANPDDLTKAKCIEFKSTGINRLSIGIQSFYDADLRFMNRAHDARQAIASVENAKESGINNISIDLIYGIQHGGENHWKDNIDTALKLNVDHLSCYALTIEPRTVLADMIRKRKIPQPDDEQTIEEFDWLISTVVDAGYEHYEISNFARNKKYSRHNTSYWQRKKYLGVGPSAHSFDNISRQWNVSNNQEYIRSLEKNIVPFEKEELTIENKINEYILTSLRTMWGLNKFFFENEFGKSKMELVLGKLEKFKLDELVFFKDGNFILTKKGKFFADRITAELFF
jgi:oxygen-independent coproporphyrinogen-3 oxidase